MSHHAPVVSMEVACAAFDLLEGLRARGVLVYLRDADLRFTIRPASALTPDEMSFLDDVEHVDAVIALLVDERSSPHTH